MRLGCGSLRGRAGMVRAAAAGGVALVLATAGTARAQHVEYKASITLTGAYTQSITDAPYPNLQTFSGPTIALSPSLISLIDTLRTDNTLTYALTLSVPFAVHANPGVNTFAVTYANHFTYSGKYALSELTTMTLGTSFTEAPINTYVPSQDPTAAPVESVPSGIEYMITTNATEGFSRQVSENNIFTQAGAFTYGHPIDPTSERAQTYSAANSFALTHTFPRDTLGVTLSNSFNYFTASQAAPTAAGEAPVILPHEAWINTLALNWMHPFTESFATTLTAGATQTLQPQSSSFMVVEPTGSVQLNYNFLLATAALTYAHAALPNMTVGTVSFTDAVNARFSMPIKVTGLTILGTLGYIHTTPIGTPTVVCPAFMTVCTASPLVTSPTHVFMGDASLEYHPERVPTLTVGLRGQLTRQIVTLDPTLANNFTRYTVALNLTYSYPNAMAATTRPQLSPLYSTAPPSASEIISTDRFFRAPVAGPAPAEPLPLPKGP